MSIFHVYVYHGSVYTKRNEVWKYLKLHGKEVNKMEPQVFSILSCYYFHPDC